MSDDCLVTGVSTKTGEPMLLRFKDVFGFSFKAQTTCMVLPTLHGAGGIELKNMKFWPPGAEIDAINEIKILLKEEKL